MATASPNTGNKRRERSTSSTRRKSSGQKDVRAAEVVVAVQEEPTAERERGAGDHRRNDPEAEDASEQVRRGSAQHERADDREVPDQRGRMQVDGEQERVEDRALHVRGVRCAGCLVRVPEWDLALRVRTMGHLRPRLERPGGRAKVGRKSDASGARLARKRCVSRSSPAASLAGRAERAAAEDDRREGDARR